MQKKLLYIIMSLMMISLLGVNITAEDNYVHELNGSVMNLDYLNGVAVSEVENSFKLDPESAALIDESQNYFYWIKEEDGWDTYEEEFLTPGKYFFIIVLSLSDDSGYEAIHHSAILHCGKYDFLTTSPAATEERQQFCLLLEVKEHHHNYELVKGYEATCLESGLHDYYQCDCGLYFEAENATKPIKNLDEWKKGLGLLNPLGHDLEKIEGVEASEISEGSKAYYHCRRCDLNFEDEKATKTINDIESWRKIPKLSEQVEVHKDNTISPMIYIGGGAIAGIVVILIVSKFKK